MSKDERINYRATFSNGETLEFHGDNRELAKDHADYCARIDGTTVVRLTYIPSDCWPKAVRS